MRAKELREEARNCLQGKWGKAIAISIIYTMITFAISLLATYVHPLFGIITFIITPAITYGIAHSYYHLKNGEEVGYFDFLKVSFSNFGRGWGIAWHIFLKVWWILFVIFLPVLIIGMGILIYNNTSSAIKENSYYTGYYDSTYSYGDYLDSYYDDYDYNYDYNYDNDYLDNNSTSNLYDEKDITSLGTAIASMGIGLMIGLIVFIVIIVLITIRMLLYTFAYYIAVAKENITTKEAVNESARLMKGNRGRYVCLILSFIGWALLLGLVSSLVGILKVGILTDLATLLPSAILAPYMAFATIALYQDIERSNNITNTQNYAYVSGNNSTMNSQNIQTQNGYQINTGSIPVQNSYQVNSENTTLQNDEKYCSKCGTENKNDAIFCTNCGNKF